jgi:hypothetical protein
MSIGGSFEEADASITSVGISSKLYLFSSDFLLSIFYHVIPAAAQRRAGIQQLIETDGFPLSRE